MWHLTVGPVKVQQIMMYNSVQINQVMEHPENVQRIMMDNKMVNLEEGHVHLSDIEVQMEHLIHSQVKVQ